MPPFDSIQTSLTLLQRLKNPQDHLSWQQGWETFWHRYEQFIRQWAWRLRKKGYKLDDPTLDDVVGEVIANLQRTLGKPDWQYETGGNFQGYLARTIDNTVNRLLERRDRQLATSDVGGTIIREQLQNVPIEESLGSTLGSQLAEEYRQVRDCWEQALEECRSAQAREAAERMLLQDQSSAEVAEALGITEGAAKMAAMRVRKRLRLIYGSKMSSKNDLQQESQSHED